MRKPARSAAQWTAIRVNVGIPAETPASRPAATKTPAKVATTETAPAKVATTKTAGVSTASETTTVPTAAALSPNGNGQDQDKRRNGHPTAHTDFIISPHGNTPNSEADPYPDGGSRLY